MLESPAPLDLVRLSRWRFRGWPRLRSARVMGKNFSFYEQTAILIPGAGLVFGLLFFFPDFRMLFFSDGVSIGGLGLFLLISYAAGHLAAALGSIMEMCVRAGRGRPSNWVVREA